MSKRMVTYSVSGDDKIASIDGHELGAGGVGDKSISRRMITYQVDDTGKITSIDGHELNGGGGDYQIKELVVTENGVYDVAGEAYKPVRVNVPSVESGTVKALLDATHTAGSLFSGYKGSSVDGLISPQDTTNVVKMNGMFFECSNLTTIPALDTSNCTDMGYMFRYCSNLRTIPALDTSKVTTMISMFEDCSKLTSIPALNVSKVTNMSSMLYNCGSVTSIGMYGFTHSINISGTSLKHDALVAFLNQAGDAHDSSQTITMGSDKLALLSDEEKAIATNKGWKLA